MSARKFWSRFHGVWLLGLLCLCHAAAAQTIYYVHTDALGSIVAESDSAGQVVSRREYEPYGQQLTPAVQDGPGYTGHVQDAATGLTYTQQRYYDPELGVFHSVDPVMAYDEPGAGFNRYRYANSNPYKFFDPDGRQAAERFVEQHRRDMAVGNEKAYEPLLPVAIVVTAAMAAPAIFVGGKEVAMAALANPGAVAATTEVAAAAAGVTGTASAVSTLKPGPFAGASIPARSAAQTFTSVERAAINKIGQATGCHTCGTKNPGTKSGNFVPDHQPVSSLNRANEPQRLLPQCLSCSRKQGLDAARELRRKP